jgi:hypothetical protein
MVLHKYNPIHNQTDDHFQVVYLSNIFFISKSVNHTQLSSISICIFHFFDMTDINTSHDFFEITLTALLNKLSIT